MPRIISTSTPITEKASTSTYSVINQVENNVENEKELHQPEDTFSTLTDLNNSNCGPNSSFLSYCSTEIAIQFDLESVLNSDIVGRAILQKYRTHLKLEARDRITICDIIITYFLNKSFKLNNESLSIIANKIPWAAAASM